MFDSDRTYTVTIEGTLSWDLVYDYSSYGNTITIHDERTIITTASIDYAAFKQTFNEAARKELEKKHAASQFEGASYEAIALDEPIISTAISSEILETLYQTTSSTFNSNYNKTASHASHEVTIGPDFKRATLWQQRFTSSGISVLGSAVSTSPNAPEVVTIRYLIRPIRFVRGIEVHYGDKPSDAPPNRILEYSGKNNSVNAEHGGKYVWLVPIYTYNAFQAATRFDLFIQEQYHGGWDDILQGAGGNYCYLQVVEDANSLSKITEIKLYRSDVPVTGLPHPYTSRTTSINEGRSGSYLYLMWSTTTAF